MYKFTSFTTVVFKGNSNTNCDLHCVRRSRCSHSRLIELNKLKSDLIEFLLYYCSHVQGVPWRFTLFNLSNPQ